jgi:fructokinase
MILVCGEALIDLFVSKTPSGKLMTEAVLGGSPFNVAICVSRLGHPASFCGGLSLDGFGEALRERLEQEGVDLSYAVRSERLTTISAVATDNLGQPSYSFHGENKADREVTPADMPLQLPKEVKALTFGSYTIAVPPAADAFLALARREAPNRVISVDPNLRPTVTPDLADWHRRFKPFVQLADIIKASEEDIETAYGPKIAIEDVARSWIKSGVSLVFVTRGAQGAIGFLKSGEQATEPGRSIEVIDTVGAGDTFHAAVLTHLARLGKLDKEALATLTIAELRIILSYAIAASSITCTRKGADLPAHAEIMQVLGG